MVKRILIQYYHTPFGELMLGSFQEHLVLCDWRYRKLRTSLDQRIQKALDADFCEDSSAIIAETKSQLSEYFEGKRENFDLNFRFIGTDFQQSVWKTLLEIPYGETTSYLQLAQRLRNAEAIRAVATANGANALSIIVPCHRIIGSDGKLVGYAGGLTAKKKLLKLEGAKTISMQTELFES